MLSNIQTMTTKSLEKHYSAATVTGLASHVAPECETYDIL